MKVPETLDDIRKLKIGINKTILAVEVDGKRHFVRLEYFSITEDCIKYLESLNVYEFFGKSMAFSKDQLIQWLEKKSQEQIKYIIPCIQLMARPAFGSCSKMRFGFDEVRVVDALEIFQDYGMRLYRIYNEF